MRAPEFWQVRGPAACLLAPLGAVIAAAGTLRRRLKTPERVAVPVICVGNLVVGGAGKTPVALALIALLNDLDMRVHILTRGYGGSLAGPILVDPSTHDAASVGDEPLLLATRAPTWVSHDRAAGARAAVAAGANVIVMDDGLQNGDLAHDWDIIVIDGGVGFGNGLLMPAGPLREPIAAGVARARFAIIIGDDRSQAAVALGADLPILRARLKALGSPQEWAGRRVLGFAGIGRPKKFFETLRALDAVLVDEVAFSDHHPYEIAEIEALRRRARELDAALITTEKDFIRLPMGERSGIGVLPVELEWAAAAEAKIRAALVELFDHSVKP